LQQLLQYWQKVTRVGEADDRPGGACADRDEVRDALAGLEEKIFVAEYQVRLPTEQRIKERLEELADDLRTGDT